jgi:DNA adenine methylase
MVKDASRREVLNDIDGEVVNFWRVLRDNHDALVSRLQLTPYSRDEYLMCRDEATDGLSDIERARRFFVRCNMAFNGSTARVGYSAGTPAKNGSKPSTFAKRVDERLADVAERIRRVELENADAIRLIERWSRPDTVLYLDPPYQGVTRQSRNDYAWDDSSDQFHEELAGALLKFRGTALLSGYEGSVYDSLGWRCERVHVPAHTSNRAGQFRTECLWIKENA